MNSLIDLQVRPVKITKRVLNFVQIVMIGIFIYNIKYCTYMSKLKAK